MTDHDEIVRVLTEHEWTWAKRDRKSGDGVMLGCTGCDWTHEPSGATGLGWRPFYDHLADVLLASSCHCSDCRGGPPPPCPYPRTVAGDCTHHRDNVCQTVIPHRTDDGQPREGL